MKSLEHNLQCACIRWFRMQFPQYICFAIPNGGHRNIQTAALLKKEGVLAGVADLCVLVPTRFFHGLFIEMKVGKNRQTEQQKSFGEYAVKQGYAYEVCYDLDSFIDVVTEYLSHPR